MGRTYRLLIENAVTDKKQEINKLIEAGDLTLLDEFVSVTSVTEARGIGWGMLYKAVSLTKQGINYKEEWSSAADRGTLVHLLPEDLAVWGLPEDEDEWLNKWDEDIRGFAKGVLGWWRLFKPTPIPVFGTPGWEFPVASLQHRFAGRADLFATLTRKNTLIDWKTCTSDKLERYPKAYINNRIEVVARAFAMREFGVKVDQCAIVRFTPDGQHHHLLIHKDEEQEMFDCFLRARKEHDFLAEHDVYVPSAK